MTGSTGLAALVRRSIDHLDDRLERTLFDTGDPATVAAHLERACTSTVGPPARAFRYRAGVGIVAGLVLGDGREVIGKVHRWNISPDRLRAVRTVQAAVANAGLPAPRPLGDIVECGAGLAAFEDHRPGGPADGREPSVRRTIAAGLHDLVAAARPLVDEVDVGRQTITRPDGPLWPEPHDPRLDFDATSSGAEWIDELALDARRRLASAGADAPSVIGHADWRVGNLGFAAERLVAIYDWDSVTAAPEAVIVGLTAAQFGIDWGAGEDDPVPTIPEMAAFVADYEDVRGTRFTLSEWELVDAANLALISYGARCQHSDVTLRPGIGAGADTRWLRALTERRSVALRPGRA
ncbi:MAG: phosphotransferase [Actinomycetota bacterium]|nr:phosphotransferase [Actinomycetota bacterium]